MPSAHPRGRPRVGAPSLGGEASESPLDHSSGLGPWTAKRLAESYGGDPAFDPETRLGAVVLSPPDATGAL